MKFSFRDFIGVRNIAVVRWGNGIFLFELSGEIVAVVKTYPVTDFGNAHVGVCKQITGMFHSDIDQILHRSTFVFRDKKLP